MNRSATAALLLAGLLASLAAPSSADANPLCLRGAVGVFFDSLGTVPCQSDLLPGAAFEIFVVGFDLDGGILGYEFSVDNPVGPFVLSRTTNPPGVLETAEGDDNWYVRTGMCMDGAGPVWLLMERVILFAPQNDLWFCVQGAITGSSILNDRPGWLACDETLHPFTILEPVPDLPGCAVGNDTHGGCGVLAAGDDSWGAHKARFRE